MTMPTAVISAMTMRFLYKCVGYCVFEDFIWESVNGVLAVMDIVYVYVCLHMYLCECMLCVNK